MPPNVKNDLLDVIERNEHMEDLLSNRAGRTHAFLGIKRRGVDERLFSRHGDDGCKPCLLTQLYKKWYPKNPEPPTHPEYLVQYEWQGYDCMYFERPRETDKFGNPIEWETGWLIEVENDINEFSFTLRCMLDLLCRYRLGVFFASEFDVAGLSDRFRGVWQMFLNRFSFAKRFNVAALILPEWYTDFEQYARGAALLSWNVETCCFEKL